MNKIEELKSVIGKEVSENFSPTLRAKLISINENTGICTMEVAESPYVGSWSWQQNDTTGHRYEAPVYRIWNAFFF